MANKVQPRNKMNKKYTWNAQSVFRSNKAWEKEVKQIVADLPTLKKFQGKLKEGPTVLLKALTAYDKLVSRAQTAAMYAVFLYNVDTTNQESTGMQSKAMGMYGQVASAVSFMQPEILAVGKKKINKWVRENRKLKMYEHSFENLFRKQAHVRSAEVEEILGMLIEPLDGASTSTSMLTNADFKFGRIQDSKGKVLDIAQGTIAQIMHMPDRKARKLAYQTYMDQYVAHKNTLATNLSTSINANVFYMRARKHEDTLSASLFDLNIPTSVFHNLIDTFKKNLPVWHRYFELRRKALGLKKVAYYDMWAPIVKKNVKVPYEKAVDLISESLAPMGKDYVDTLRRGTLKERWVDVYPNQGKSQGAFSYGTPSTHPFIMMSYTDNVESMSTLAHELGHSMHSYLTWQNQPFVYTDYSLFVAEVASNFHQAMMRGHLLNSNINKYFKLLTDRGGCRRKLL